MRAAGTLYMSHTKPLATVSKDGMYQLTLLLFDRLGAHRVEPWRVTYFGPDAKRWLDANAAQLVAGARVLVALERLRNFTNGSRSGGPEFVADVISIELFPITSQTACSLRKPCVTSY